MKLATLAALALGFGGALPASADGPVVERVEAQSRSGTWRFSVTLSHPDTGWDHYADAWEITTLEGERLGDRPLAHPHVDEQPFTRSQSAVVIPDGVDAVLVRGRDNLGHWGEPVRFSLP